MRKVFSFLFLFSFLFPLFVRASVIEDTIHGVGNYYLASVSDIKNAVTDTLIQTHGFYGPLFRRSMDIYMSLGDIVIHGTEKVRLVLDGVGRESLKGYEEVGQSVANVLFSISNK